VGALLGMASACTWSDDLVADTFTADQWARLQDDYRPPLPPDPCTLPGLGNVDPMRCVVLARLGQQLFFDPGLSSNCSVSCATCHDPTRSFADPRVANNVSAGALTFTGRNAISLVNVALKDDLAPPAHHAVFTWDGRYKSPGAVLALAAGKPMGNDAAERIARVVRDHPTYRAEYEALFAAPSSDDAAVFTNLKLAFDAYLRRLVSLDAPFDRFITGEAPEAISARAQHGFGLFVGKAMCAECHRGNLFTDFAFHATGVPQAGASVPASDPGRQKVTMQAEDASRFFTPTLRGVSAPAPYMHDGWMASLAEVIAFYRAGGGPVPLPGMRDALLEPLEISDDDARDLEEFLRTLDGRPIPAEWTRDTHVEGLCPAAR